MNTHPSHNDAARCVRVALLALDVDLDDPPHWLDQRVYNEAARFTTLRVPLWSEIEGWAVQTAKRIAAQLAP